MKSCVQSISQENLAKATYILRDKIYNDKPKAALTETLCNAVDEHRKYNVQRPVEVFLNTKELVIRDFAKGLDEDGVMHVYAQYFTSSKSHSNDAIGGFGIGAKAPSAYTRNHNIESYYGGKKTVYVSSVDGFASVISKIYEEDVDPSNTGICVRIPIKSEDFNIFFNLIKDLYRQIGFYDANTPFSFYVDERWGGLDYEQYILDRATYNNNDANSQYVTYVDSREKFRKQFGQILADYLTDKTDNFTYVKDTLIMAPRYFGRGGYYNSSYYLFSSSFFKNSHVYAYDGDVCYKIGSQFQVSKILGNSCDFNTIFLFKRGELPVMPSREEIELTPTVLAFLEEKAKIAAEAFKTRTSDIIASACTGVTTPYFVAVRDIISVYPLDRSNLYSSLNTVVHVTLPTNCKVYRAHKNPAREDIINTLRIGSNYRQYSLDANTVVVFAKQEEKVSRDKLFSAIKNYAIEKSGQTAWDKRYNRNVLDIVFVWGDDVKTFIADVKKELKCDFWRKDIDYYEYDDIIGYSTFVSAKAATQRRKTDAIKTYLGHTVDEKDFGSVMLVTPSELTDKSSKLNLSELYENYKVSGGYFKIFSEVTGIKHIVECYKNSIAKYVKAGCKTPSMIDHTDLFIKYLKNKQFQLVSPKGVTLLKLVGHNFKLPNGTSLTTMESYDSYGDSDITRYINKGFMGINFASSQFIESMNDILDKIFSAWALEDIENLMQIKTISVIAGYGESYYEFKSFPAALTRSYIANNRKRLAELREEYRPIIQDIFQNIDYFSILKQTIK